MTNWPCILGEDFLGHVMYNSGEGLTGTFSSMIGTHGSFPLL